MNNLYSDFSQLGGGMATFDASGAMLGQQFGGGGMNGFSEFTNLNPQMASFDGGLGGGELAMPLVSNQLDISELGLMNSGFGGLDMNMGLGMNGGLGMGMGMGMDNLGMDMDMAMNKMAMDSAMAMGMGMGMGMEPGLGMGMGMEMQMAAMGLGMNEFCLDHCNMANECCEHCKCCECQCEEVVRCNAAYLCPLGIIRLGIIICLVAGSAAAWAIAWDLAMFYAINAIFWSTREGYIVVAAIALFFSFMFFLFGILNFYNLRGVSPLFWIAFINFCDLLMLLGMLGVSITACVREAQVPANDFEDIIHQGAFAAAGICGLLAVALYIVHMVCTIPIAMALYV